MLAVVPPDGANSDFTIVRAIVYRFDGRSGENLRGIDKVDTVLIEIGLSLRIIPFEFDGWTLRRSLDNTRIVYPSASVGLLPPLMRSAETPRPVLENGPT